MKQDYDWKTGPQGLAMVTRDGENRCVGTLNECFAYILKHQGQSVSYACRHAGWDVVPYDDGSQTPVSYIRFAEEYDVPIEEVHTMTRLARRAKVAQEEYLSYNRPGLEQSAKETREEFGRHAYGLGFVTLWEALWPTLRRGDEPRDIRPPID